jgi:hypothetical protein
VDRHDDELVIDQWPAPASRAAPAPAPETSAAWTSSAEAASATSSAESRSHDFPELVALFLVEVSRASSIEKRFRFLAVFLGQPLQHASWVEAPA